MSGGSMEASVLLRLIDDVSAPGRKAAASIREITRDIKALKSALGGGRSLNLGREFQTIARQARAATSAVSALKSDLAKPARSGFSRAELGLDRVAKDARAATASVRSLRREMADGATFRGRGVDRPVAGGRSRRRGHGGGDDVSGRAAAAGIVGVAAAHEAASFAREAISTYREFDKERRFGAAVMGISFDDQQALIRQAIGMGGRTKYNDISVLEGQRELAARGLGKDAILGMMPSAANLGMSLDMGLPDAVKLMDQAVFSFKKNIGSVADATASATQTADAIVKSAKISGMTPEDIAATYRFGGTPAKMSGVSENTLLSFGGVLKRANISGDMGGTAFRAFIAAAQAPTRGAKEALLANGLDYSKYQPQITSIPVDPFVKNVAAQYGVKLKDDAVEAIRKVFNSPALLNDGAKFTPAVVDAIGDSLGKKDSKSLKSISGMANRFRNSIGGGANVNGFLSDLMLKLPGNLKLANSLFGAKQGSRIATALGDPDVFKALKNQLDNHSTGFAQSISDARMSGFDGAVSRFEGATKNLETAIGRAFDANGKGGALTGFTSQIAALTQAFAEAPPQVQRLGTEAAAVAAVFAGMKGAEALLGGFGLKASAAALTGAAEALTAAAGAQKMVNAAKDVGGGAAIGSMKGRVTTMGIGLGLAALNAPSNLVQTANGKSYLDFGPNGSPAERFDAWWQKHIPSASSIGKWLGHSVISPAEGAEAHKSPYGGLGFDRSIFSPTKEIRSIASAASASIPTFAAAGTSAMTALASGLGAGEGQATGKMSGLMASLAAIAARGVDVDVRLNTADAEARLSALMSRAGSIGKSGGDGRFSKALSDTGQ